MTEFFGWLMSTDNFLPHGHCFLWQPATLWLNVGSDALIGASYFAIPVAIFHYTRQRRAAFHYAWIPVMFASFILLCGATHVMEIWTVWDPVYRAAGVVKLLTGAVSLATVTSLIWVMPRAMLLKTPGELHAEVDARTGELTALNARLSAEIAARDVAEQRLGVVEEERARADALLRAIVESAPSLIYAKDLEGRMLLANPRALELIGKPWQDVKGRTDLEVLDDHAQAEAVTRNDRRLMQDNKAEEFEEAVGSDGGAERVWFSIKAPLRDVHGTVTGLVGVSVEITERKRLEQRLRLMVDELNHRVKNTLATVQAIAAQSLRGVDPSRYEAFQERLQSLAAAHDVLTRDSWTGADLRDIAVGQMAAHGGEVGRRMDLSGPPVMLNSRAALALAMGLHELATNALKHGALSSDAGRVLLHWEVTAGATPSLRLSWTERHGPAIAPPVRRGYGSRLIEVSMARDLGALVRLDFTNPGGISCSIEAPLAQICASTAAVQFPRVGVVWNATP